MSQTAPERVDVYLSRLSAFHLSSPCDPARLRQCSEAWRSCVTEQVASHVVPAFYTKGRLTLFADSSVWLHKLTQQQSLLIRQLRQHSCFHDLAAIRIRVEPLAAPRAECPVVLPDLSPVARSIISQSAEGVSDPALKAALYRLAGNSRE